jgi:hypothetical protein
MSTPLIGIQIILQHVFCVHVRILAMAKRKLITAGEMARAERG